MKLEIENLLRFRSIYLGQEFDICFNLNIGLLMCHPMNDFI